MFDKILSIDMKNTRVLIILVVILLTTTEMFAQLLPGDPGYPGGGASVPLDGGLLLALLAAGGVGASLFAKSKKKEK